MKNLKTRKTISLLLNLAAAMLAIASVGWFFTPQGRLSGVGNMTSGGAGCLMFFTVDSNLLAALCSLLLVPFTMKSIISGKDEAPAWVLILKFVGTTAVTVTLLVVLLFLGPILGYRLMYEGNCLELHLLCPLLAIVSFCFFDGGIVFSKKQMLWGILPTVIYGTVYLVNVIFTQSWVDFYHFNIGGCWYITYLVMPGITYLFALALCSLHNKSIKALQHQNTSVF